MSDRIISEGEEWVVTDVLNDRDFKWSSWNTFDPERDARRFYDVAPWSFVRLVRRKVVIHEAELVEERREAEDDKAPEEGEDA